MSKSRERLLFMMVFFTCKVSVWVYYNTLTARVRGTDADRSKEFNSRLSEIYNEMNREFEGGA